MSNKNDSNVLEMSPDLKLAVDALIQTGLDLMTAVKQLATTRPELFTTPGDEVAKMLATWD